MIKGMAGILAGGLLWALNVSQVQALELETYGFIATKFGGVDTSRSWTEGGFGRLDFGQDGGISGGGKRELFGALEAHLGIDVLISEQFWWHSQVLARTSIDGGSGAGNGGDIGLVEAFLGFDAVNSDINQLTFTLGQKFFPTSFENTDDLWQSPYTLNYSVWNSWIAHEFRPIGLETSYSHLFQNQARLTLRGNAFVGNDSSGALLAWGGWRSSQRLSVLGEVLPLPPLLSLSDSGSFNEQRDDGSKPFGPDLDNELGYAGQAAFDYDALKLKYSYVDTQGDTHLYRGEYAWRTRFQVIGAEYSLAENWTLLAEHAQGETTMGNEVIRVDVNFSASYLMASYHRGDHRVSVRREIFDLDDRDGFLNDSSEKGKAWTVAYLYSSDNWRYALDITRVSVNKISAVQSGFEANNDGTQLSAEIRYVF